MRVVMASIVALAMCSVVGVAQQQPLGNMSAMGVRYTPHGPAVAVAPLSKQNFNVYMQPGTCPANPSSDSPVATGVTSLRTIPFPLAAKGQYCVWAKDVNTGQLTQPLSATVPVTSHVKITQATVDGSNTRLTATVSGSGPAPTGSITFSISAPTTSVPFMVPLSNGQTSTVFPTALLQKYVVMASYSGDTNYMPNNYLFRPSMLVAPPPMTTAKRHWYKR